MPALMLQHHISSVLLGLCAHLTQPVGLHGHSTLLDYLCSMRLLSRVPDECSESHLFIGSQHINQLVVALPVKQRGMQALRKYFKCHELGMNMEGEYSYSYVVRNNSGNPRALSNCTAGKLDLSLDLWSAAAWAVDCYHVLLASGEHGPKVLDQRTRMAAFCIDLASFHACMIQHALVAWSGLHAPPCCMLQSCSQVCNSYPFMQAIGKRGTKLLNYPNPSSFHNLKTCQGIQNPVQQLLNAPLALQRVKLEMQARSGLPVSDELATRRVRPNCMGACSVPVPGARLLTPPVARWCRTPCAHLQQTRK
jgi:hypothetical protein